MTFLYKPLVPRICVYRSYISSYYKNGSLSAPTIGDSSLIYDSHKVSVSSQNLIISEKECSSVSYISSTLEIASLVVYGGVVLSSLSLTSTLSYTYKRFELFSLTYNFSFIINFSSVSSYKKESFFLIEVFLSKIDFNVSKYLVFSSFSKNANDESLANWRSL